MTSSFPAVFGRGRCLDCDRRMISQSDYNGMTAEQREPYVRVASYGMCNGCYGRARRHGTLPNPAPRKSVRNNAPLCWVERTYAARCAEHGEVGRGATRAEAEAIGARHAKARHDGSVRRPPTAKALDEGTLSRLRASVGVEVAS